MRRSKFELRNSLLVILVGLFVAALMIGVRNFLDLFYAPPSLRLVAVAVLVGAPVWLLFCWRARWFRSVQGRLGITRLCDVRSLVILTVWLVASLGYHVAVGSNVDVSKLTAWSGSLLTWTLTPALLIIGGGLYQKAFIGVSLAIYDVIMGRVAFTLTDRYLEGHFTEIPQNLVTLIPLSMLIYWLAVSFFIAGLLNTFLCRIGMYKTR